MMESAYDRSDSKLALPGPRFRKGCLQAEAAVRSILVGVVDELGRDLPQMVLR
jgi:hypothetical protein